MLKPAPHLSQVTSRHLVIFIISACAISSQIRLISIIQAQRSAGNILRAHHDCAAILLVRA